MTPTSARSPRVAVAGMLPLVCSALLAMILSAFAEPASMQSFSAGDSQTISVAGDPPAAEEVEAIDFRVAVGKMSKPAPVLTLSDGTGSITSISDGKSLAFRADTGGGTPADYNLAFQLPEGPKGFSKTDTDGGLCDQLPDDGIAAAQLLDRYGNHYAYAVIYGARIMGWAKMTSTALESLSSNEVNVSDGIGFKISSSLNTPGGGKKGTGSVNAGGGGNASNSSGSSDWTSAQSEVSLDTKNYVCFGGSGRSNSGTNVRDDPIPIYLDLRPVSDLRGSPYFTDPDITVMLRWDLQKAFGAFEGQTEKDHPLVQIRDVTVKDVSCSFKKLPVPAKRYAKIADAQTGPFAAGWRYDKVDFPIADLTRGADSWKIDDVPELCRRHAFHRSMIQAVGVMPDGSEDVLNISAEASLSDLKSGAKPPTLITPFQRTIVDSTGQPAFRFYFRLREVKDAADMACPGSCTFFVASQVGGLPTLDGDRLDNIGFESFPLFPRFEIWNPVEYDSAGTDISIVLGRGVVNVFDDDTPSEYQMDLKLEVTARDLQNTLGFTSGAAGRAPHCKGRTPDFTVLSAVGGSGSHGFSFRMTAHISLMTSAASVSTAARTG